MMKLGSRHGGGNGVARRGMAVVVMVSLVAVLQAGVVLVVIGSGEDVTTSVSRLESVRALAAADSAVIAALRSSRGEIESIQPGTEVRFGSATAVVIDAPVPGEIGEIIASGVSGRGERMLGIGIE